MSLLKKVSGALKANRDIIIAGVTTTEFGPREDDWMSMNFAQIVHFFIAPRVGLYRKDELTAFSRGLAIQLTPTSQDSFVETVETLTFGALYFDEEMALEEAKTLLPEPRLTINFPRRVLVRIYPDQRIARCAVGPGRLYEHSIPRSELPVPQEKLPPAV